MSGSRSRTESSWWCGYLLFNVVTRAATERRYSEKKKHLPIPRRNSWGGRNARLLALPHHVVFLFLRHSFPRAKIQKFCHMEKMSYLCSRFQQEIIEALYLRLANGNLRNFYERQEWYDGFARIAWAVSVSSFQGNSQDLHSGKWYAAPRFVCIWINIKERIKYETNYHSWTGNDACPRRNGTKWSLDLQRCSN